MGEKIPGKRLQTRDHTVKNFSPNLNMEERPVKEIFLFAELRNFPDLFK